MEPEPSRAHPARPAFRGARIVLWSGAALLLAAAGVQGADSIVVDNPGDHVSAACPGETCTLRDAILVANANATHTTITFDPDIVAINLTSPLPDITAPITLIGPGPALNSNFSDPAPTATFRINDTANGTRISALNLTGLGNATAALDAHASAVMLDNLTITGYQGEIIYLRGTATVADSTITANTNRAIFATGGQNHSILRNTLPASASASVAIDAPNVTVQGNTIGPAPGGCSACTGHGIHLRPGAHRALVGGSAGIDGNTIVGLPIGAGIYVEGETILASGLPVRNVTIEGNAIGVHSNGTASGVAGPTIRAHNSDGLWIEGNTLAHSGGGIVVESALFYPANADVYITLNDIHNNTASTGAGIRLDDVRDGADADNLSAIVESNIIVDNNASLDGGGIAAVETSDVWLVANVILNNTATYSGGGIFAMDWLEQELFLTSAFGGSTLADARPPVDRGIHIHGNQLLGNDALDGGGIFVAGDGAHAGIGLLSWPNTVQFNEGYGGGITVTRDARAFIVGNLIADNTGAGVLGYERSSAIHLSQNAITRNTGLGIDVAFPNEGPPLLGPTANDLGDLDLITNFPMVAQVLDASITMTWNHGSDLVVFEFFASASCDAAGFGEGTRILGDAVVQAPGGNITVTAGPYSVVSGEFVTATATTANGTSEFSACRQASVSPPPSSNNNRNPVPEPQPDPEPQPPATPPPPPPPPAPPSDDTPPPEDPPEGPTAEQQTKPANGNGILQSAFARGLGFNTDSLIVIRDAASTQQLEVTEINRAVFVTYEGPQHPAWLRIVLVNDHGERTVLSEGSKQAFVDAQAWPAGFYTIQVEQQRSNGQHYLLESTTVRIHQPPTTVTVAVTTAAAGAAIVASGSSITSVLAARGAGAAQAAAQESLIGLGEDRMRDALQAAKQRLQQRRGLGAFLLAMAAIIAMMIASPQWWLEGTAAVLPALALVSAAGAGSGVAAPNALRRALSHLNARDALGIAVTVAIMTVFFAVEAMEQNSLREWLGLVPLVGAVAGAFALAAFGTEWFVAAASGHAARFRMMWSGALTLALSTVFMRTAFGYPGYVEEKDVGEGDPLHVEAVRAMATISGVVALMLPFAIIGAFWRYDVLDEGMNVALAALAAICMPLKPLPGGDINAWNRPMSWLVMLGGLAMFFAYQIGILTIAALAIITTLAALFYAYTIMVLVARRHEWRAYLAARQAVARARTKLTAAVPAPVRRGYRLSVSTLLRWEASVKASMRRAMRPVRRGILWVAQPIMNATAEIVVRLRKEPKEATKDDLDSMKTWTRRSPRLVGFKPARLERPKRPLRAKQKEPGFTATKRHKPREPVVHRKKR